MSRASASAHASSPSSLRRSVAPSLASSPSSLRRSVAPSLDSSPSHLRACDIRNPQSAIRYSPSAFTLIELLVVIGIIVLMLGLAVAAFNQITGNRSVAMGSNQVSAYLSLARSQAMSGGAGVDPNADCGVLFYRDPQTGRTAMTLVWRLPSDPGDLDPNDRYKAWQPGFAYVSGDRVVALTRDHQAVWNGTAWEPRILTKTYRRTANNAGFTTRPPALGPRPDGLFANTEWEEVIPGNITPVAGFEPQFLPNGVAVQTVNDPRGNNRDRYLRTGVVLFDRLGRLDYQTWALSPRDFTGQLLGLASVTPAPAVGVYSQLGLVLYDETKFSADATHTDGDSLFGIPSLTAPNTWADEQNEETWLDQNTTLLLVNRANGTLIKGE